MRLPGPVLPAMLALGAVTAAATADEASVPCPALSAEPRAAFARLTVGANCGAQTILGLGAAETCLWVHPYRDAGARRRFVRLAGLLAECTGDPAPADTPRVNHPDSYEQLRFESGGVIWLLALKDKAGLAQSLVFLTMAGAPG